MDALHGDLRTFPLDRVVRMISEARQTGVLRVEAGPHTGRIFFVDGAVTYATTRDGDGSVAELRKIRTAPGHERRRGSTRGPFPMRDLILQQIAEVYLRLERQGTGRFWFVDGVVTRAYGTDPEERFERDEVARFVDERREGWRQIHRSISSGSTRFRLRPTIDEPIAVEPADWEVLAAIDGARSIQEIAERLEMFEFSAAAAVASLVQRGLVVTADEAVRLEDEARMLVIDIETLPPIQDAG